MPLQINVQRRSLFNLPFLIMFNILVYEHVFDAITDGVDGGSMTAGQTVAASDANDAKTKGIFVDILADYV